MISDYPRLLNLLSDLQKPLRVNQVSQQMQAFSEQPYFINLLQHAIKDPSLTYSLKLNAVVTLNRAIKNHLSELSAMKVLEVLMDIVLNFDIDIKHKTALETSLTAIFEETELELIGEIIEKLHTLLISTQNSIQNVCSSVQYQPNHQTHSWQLQQNLYQILKVIMLVVRCIPEDIYASQLGQIIKQIFQPSLRVVSLTLDPVALSLLADLSYFWAQILQKLLNNRFLNGLTLVDEMCLSPRLNDWILQLYQMGCSPSQQCFINPSQVELASNLNRMKKNAASLHKIIISHFSKVKSNASQHLWKHVLDKSYSIINTLTVYASHLSHFTTYEQFAVELLGVLILTLHENREYFQKHYANIMHMVLFPLLAVTEQQLLLFQNDPQEFMYLAEDCCDQQKYFTLKTQTSRLLETVCDDNIQATQYAIQHALISVKVRLSLDQNLQNSAHNFLHIETALLILSILSYCLSKHPEELQELRSILVPSKMQGRISQLQLARLFTFLAYNYTDIYPNPSEGEAWVKWALKEDSQRTVSLCALDFISNIANQYFSQNFLMQFAGIVWPLENQHPKKLSTLLKIMGAHLPKISQSCLLVIVEQLLATTKQQIELYKQRQKSNTLDIVNILQMIRRVIDNCCLNSRERLKQAIMKYVDLLQEMVSIHLDDQIVKIVTAIIRQQRTLSQHQIDMLQTFCRLFQDGRQNQTAYLLLLNCYLTLGTSEIRSKLILVMADALLALYVHSRDNPTSARDKIAIASICLLLQNVVATFGHELTPEELNSLKKIALFLIPQSDNPQDKIEPMVIARALNLLFLVHMHQRDDTALRKLLLFQDSYIFRGYDLKVLSACIHNDIFRDADVVSITEMINVLTKTISRTREEAIVIRSKKNANSIKSDTKIRIKRIEDYEQILKYIETPFSQDILPEAELKKIIDQMRSNNPFAYQAIIKSLTSPVYSSLKKVISQVTIEGRKRSILHVGEVRATSANLQQTQSRKRLLQDEQDSMQEQQQSKLKLVQKKKKRESLQQMM